MFLARCDSLLPFAAMASSGSPEGITPILEEGDEELGLPDTSEVSASEAQSAPAHIQAKKKKAKRASKPRKKIVAMPAEEWDLERGDLEAANLRIPSAAELLATGPTKPGSVKEVVGSLLTVETAAAEASSAEVQWGKSGKSGNEKDEKFEKSKEKTANEESKVKHADEKLKPEVPSLMHGKFSTDGRFQEFVYVPTSDYADVNSKSTELFDTILRHWNMQRPQLLIKFQSGFAHPKHLLAKEEIDKFREAFKRTGEEPELYKYYNHFEAYLREKQKGETIDKKEQAKLEEKALKLLNEFLYKSLSVIS
eukprot:s2874_g2.t1